MENLPNTTGKLTNAEAEHQPSPDTMKEIIQAVGLMSCWFDGFELVHACNLPHCIICF